MVRFHCRDDPLIRSEFLQDSHAYLYMRALHFMVESLADVVD